MEANLLDAIYAAPGDDGPRLIYAVWKASEAARARLAAVLERHGVPEVAFEKSTG